MTSTAITKNDSNSHVTREQARDLPTFTPRFDIWETKEEIVLSGDLPGVSRDDLEIQFEQDQLLIHGRVAPRGEQRKSLHAEYEVGSFERSFTVGEYIDSERISAELSDGVLTIHLPKSDRVKPRRIDVKGA